LAQDCLAEVLASRLRTAVGNKKKCTQTQSNVQSTFQKYNETKNGRIKYDTFKALKLTKSPIQYMSLFWNYTLWLKPLSRHC